MACSTPKFDYHFFLGTLYSKYKKRSFLTVYAYILQISDLQQLGNRANTRKAQFWQYMHMFSKYHICDKSATIWHHVQIHKKATFLQHIGNRWLCGICSPATGAKIYAKLFICLYAKMAKMSDFSNHNVFAYMLASCANLNFHPVYIWVSVTCVTLFVNCKSLKLH